MCRLQGGKSERQGGGHGFQGLAAHKLTNS
jgi:hypothetical protein